MQAGPDARVEVTYARGPDVDAHAVLREAVARWTGTDEVAVRHLCPHCGDDGHGRPLVRAPGVGAVSLSRTDGLVAVAVTGRPGVGVDVERLCAERFAGVATVARHHGEAPADLDGLARLWVRKEAVLKACGLGLVVPMGALSIAEDHDGPALDAWPESEGPRPAVTIEDLAVGSPYVGSVAVTGGPVEVVLTQAGPATAPPRARTRREPPPPRRRARVR